MSDISKALHWAAAILLLALGNAAGLIDDKTAGTMFVVLPVMAVIALNRGRGCRLPWRRAGA